jgi:hypothetical protein
MIVEVMAQSCMCLMADDQEGSWYGEGSWENGHWRLTDDGSSSSL